MRRIVTEVYSRVSGYFRPVNQWNKGKQSEYSERKVAHLNREVQSGERIGGEINR